MTVPAMKYPVIKMTNKYANSVDERGKKTGVPKKLVGIRERDLSQSRLGLYSFSAPSHLSCRMGSATPNRGAVKL
jgi:hypothetical protein